jgi:hypothetical protein
MKKVSLTICALAFLVGAANAQTSTPLIDYQGYSWETGGFPPSNALDVMSMVSVVVNLDPVFNVNLAVDELTVYVKDLVSTGQVAFGGGFFGINYVGGNIELWQDNSPDAVFGTGPFPSATVPSTFNNGTLFLGGVFTSFFLFFDTTFGVGSYEGYITLTGGTALGSVPGLQNNAFTFGGVLDTTASGGNVPAGYDLQIDGTIETKVVVAVEQKSWSGIKSLYGGR